ncbi:SGNH hydrolase domain-containing protein [Nocardioides sp. W7]|uniref:SGNH hydrolase domain-containing protein n=1 Tax=Nocardioides sp. W7 TaxID=2931390 RepID=UPI001FD2C084|nr:SGNH hydrolase domain-containing protein [Nocardioides sp. W7]
MTCASSVRQLARRLGVVVLGTLVAAALAPGPTSSAAPVRPSPARAYQDVPALYETNCVVSVTGRGFKTCPFGDERGRKTVVLVGDSKAAQWFTPMDRIAKAQGWRLVVILKNGCSFARVSRPEDGKRDRSCEEWGARALRTIKRMRPEVVVPVTRWSSGLPLGVASGQPTEEAMVRGLTAYWRQILRTGARLSPILDTPGPPSGDAPACVRKNRSRPARCAFPKAAAVALSGASAAREAARRMKQVEAIDMTRHMCRGSKCAAVIGGILVYRGGSHISDTYAGSRTRALLRALHRTTDGRLGRR